MMGLTTTQNLSEARTDQAKRRWRLSLFIQSIAVHHGRPFEVFATSSTVTSCSWEDGRSYEVQACAKSSSPQ